MTADWKRPLAEIAYVASECVAVREAGFTEQALSFPRSEAGLIALCAFNGIKPEQAPRGWRYWPNATMKASWERVIEALWERAACAMKAESDRAWEAYRIAHDQASDNGSFVTFGTVPFVPASCDTQPKAGDVEQAPLVSGAVANEVRQTPNSPPSDLSTDKDG